MIHNPMPIHHRWSSELGGCMRPWLPWNYNTAALRSPITLHSDSPGSVQRSPGYPVLCRSMGPTYSPPPTARTQYLGHTISSPVLHGSRSPPVPAAPGFRSGSPEPVVRPLMHSYPRQGSPMVTTYRRQGSPITWRQGNPSLGAYGRQGSPTSLATYGRQGNPTSLATYGRQGSTLWSPGASFSKVFFPPSGFQYICQDWILNNRLGTPQGNCFMFSLTS